MKKYVVIGVNDNPTYLYCLPLVIWAWRKIGWDVMMFYVGQQGSKNDLIYKTLDNQHRAMTKREQDYYRLVIVGADSIEGRKSTTIAQVSRLYACCCAHDSVFIMTTDADMLPLSDYWKIDRRALFTDRNGYGKHFLEPKPTTWGRDLTDYHFPMCYIGMLSSDWVKVMKIDKMNHNEMIRRDLENIPPRNGVWCQDQDIVTKRLLEYGEDKIRKVNRGTDIRTGYPFGRVDRSNWHLNHIQFIDAHLPHDILSNDESFKKVLTLLHHVWPKQDWSWYIQYHKEFKKL